MKTYEEAATFMADKITEEQLEKYQPLRKEIWAAPVTERFLMDCLVAPDPLQCVWAAYCCGVMVGVEMEKNELELVKPKRKRKSK